MAGQADAYKQHKALEQYWDHPWIAPFLKGLESTGVITAACQLANISRARVEKERRADPTFEAAWQAALAAHADAIYQEVWRRATGYPKPLTFRGQLTGESVEEYSDACLLALAKARVPGFNRQADGDGATVKDLTALPAEELAVLRQAAQLALARQASLPPPESGQSLDVTPESKQG